LQLQNRIQALAPYMNMLSSALENITESGTETEIPSFPLAQLLPENQERFFRYNGSLTRPPCSENVVWTVLAKQRILLVEQLVLFFNNLKDKNGARLVRNRRVSQSLGTRQVLAVTARHTAVN